ncbi:MAG: M1 family aminopeptidase [Candidatus Kapaibacterium sp.]
MRAFRLLLSFLMLTASFSMYGQNTSPSLPLLYIKQPFDVLLYDAALDLTKAPSAVMSGVCKITLRWTDNPQGNVFYFHLKGLTVDTVLVNSLKTSPTSGGIPGTSISYYSVPSPPSAKLGDTTLVTVYYHGTMTCEIGGSSGWCGGVTSQDNTLYTLGVGFVADYISTTQHWLPCYDHPSDKALFRGRFRVPRGKFAVSNGLLSNVFADSATITSEWTHDQPCATYLLTFAVDAYLPLDFGTPQLPMTVYSKVADTGATRKTFSLLPRMVSTFERKYGKYPFDKVGYVNTPTGAMEHQTMISFPTFLSRSKDTVNSTGAHELAHQWFGDEVSPEDFRNAWLTESFATYSEAVWAEELGGFAGYIKHQSGKLSGYFSTAASEGVFSLYNFPHASPSSNYPGTIYSKGAVVLGMLRYEVGDSLFYAGLQKYIETYKYSVASTANFESIFQSVVGRDLGWFFQQWVHTKGWVKLNCETTRTSSSNGTPLLTLRLRQVQPKEYGTYTNVPVEVGVKAKDGTTRYTMLMLHTDDETFTLPADIPAEYASLTINQGPSIRSLLQVGTVTSVEEDNEQRPELRIVPNPAGAIVSVEVVSSTTADAMIRITDTAGKLVLLESILLQQGTRIVNLPTSSLPSGSYWLSLEAGGRTISTQLSIQK